MRFCIAAEIGTFALKATPLSLANLLETNPHATTPYKTKQNKTNVKKPQQKKQNTKGIANRK